MYSIWDPLFLRRRSTADGFDRRRVSWHNNTDFILPFRWPKPFRVDLRVGVRVAKVWHGTPRIFLPLPWYQDERTKASVPFLSWMDVLVFSMVGSRLGSILAVLFQSLSPAFSKGIRNRSRTGWDSEQLGVDDMIERDVASFLLVVRTSSTYVTYGTLPHRVCWFAFVSTHRPREREGWKHVLLLEPRPRSAMGREAHRVGGVRHTWCAQRWKWRRNRNPWKSCGGSPNNTPSGVEPTSASTKA